MSAVARYLRLLGLAGRPPSLDALTELVQAQLTRVPFENISKLLRRRAGLRTLPDLETHLDGIEHYRFGGTCYANNHYLHWLLREVGYNVRLCGADMRNPDVHIVCVVTVAGRDCLVDGGYGAPFLAPLPLDLDHDSTLVLGDDRFVLHPRDADGHSRVDLVRDGLVRHGYRLNPKPRKIEEFAAVIEESFRDEATFMNALVVTRFFPGRSISLHNLTLVESVEDRSHTTYLPRPEALPALIEDRFGIPSAITRQAIEGVDLSQEFHG